MSAQTHAADAGHANPTGFVRRWLYSTNHKDIGTMYIIFSILAALIGGPQETRAKLVKSALMSSQLPPRDGADPTGWFAPR